MGRNQHVWIATAPLILSINPNDRQDADERIHSELPVASVDCVGNLVICACRFEEDRYRSSSFFYFLMVGRMGKRVLTLKGFSIINDLFAGNDFVNRVDGCAQILDQ